jgi:hypothetical protein
MGRRARRASQTSALSLCGYFGSFVRFLQSWRVTITYVANIVFSLCATAGALAISVPSAVKERWAVAIVFGLLAIGFLLRARAGYRRGEWR